MGCVAIIVAAGRGTRMGFDKLLAELAGRPVLQWSLDACLAAPSVSHVIVVTDKDRYAALQHAGDKEILRVDGGTDRFQSVLAGLEAVPEGCSLVAVHDGARPLVHPEQIEACIEAARDYGAAVLARRATETLKKVSRDGYTRGSVPRDDLWIMETPQVFRTSVLTRACRHVLERGLAVTDEVSAAEALGIPTRVVENPRPNPKITVPADLPMAEALLQAARARS